jgi:hypothetical protein
MKVGEICWMVMLMSNKVTSIDVVDINIGLNGVPHPSVSLFHLQLLLPDVLVPLMFSPDHFFPQHLLIAKLLAPQLLNPNPPIAFVFPNPINIAHLSYMSFLLKFSILYF